jgi:hypothetical protein
MDEEDTGYHFLSSNAQIALASRLFRVILRILHPVQGLQFGKFA